MKRSKLFYNVDDSQGITIYGKQLIRAFENKCGKSLIDESMEEGTYVLEQCITNKLDEVAWCLMTYDIGAIDVVKDWKEVFPNVYRSKDETYTYDDLIEILECCITN